MRFFAFNLDCVALCLALWLVGASGVLAQECKFVEDTCIYEGGIYHIRVPDVVDPNYRSPVVMILHDAGENGSAIINDERLIETFVDKGYAVIAPDALPRRKVRFHYKIGGPGLGAKGTRKRYRLPLSNKRFIITDINGTVRLLKSGKHTGWYFYNVDQGVYSYGPRPKIDFLGRNEIQFLRDALSDAEEKHGIDPTPVLVIGLGHGGSLVWQIACYAPKFGRILAPIGGAFWRKIPKNCRPGANLIHTHHRASKFWPLKGAKGNKRRYARTSISRNLEPCLSGCYPHLLNVGCTHSPGYSPS
jgi:polyhydroxybutyrate depolymerase